MSTPRRPVVDLDEYVAGLVADWPPLSPEARDRLAVILRGVMAPGQQVAA